MNVDVFKEEPRLKWFLIAAAVLTTLVFMVFLAFRLLGRTKRKRPAGLYTALRSSVF
jgi:HAMP domain-containing protein